MDNKKEQELKKNLDYLCKHLITSDDFYSACNNDGLCDYATKRFIKENAKSQVQEIATFLHSMVPLGGVGLTKLVTVIKNTQQDSEQHLRQMNSEFLTEAWERHQTVIIRILLSIQLREVEARLSNNMTTAVTLHTSESGDDKKLDEKAFKKQEMVLRQKIKMQEEMIRRQYKEIAKSKEDASNFKEEIESLKVLLVQTAAKIPPPPPPEPEPEPEPEVPDSEPEMTVEIQPEPEPEPVIEPEPEPEPQPEYADAEVGTEYVQTSESEVQTEEIIKEFNSVQSQTTAKFVEIDKLQKQIDALTKKIILIKNQELPFRPKPEAANRFPIAALPGRSFEMPSQEQHAQLGNLGSHTDRPNLIQSNNKMRQAKSAHPVRSKPFLPLCTPQTTERHKMTRRVSEIGAVISLEKFTFNFPPGAMKTEATVGTAEYQPTMLQVEELAHGEMFDQIRPGRRFTISSNPDTEVKEIIVTTTIPSNPEFAQSQNESLVLHKSRNRRRRMSDGDIEPFEDVTDKCHSQMSDSNKVEYTIQDFGDYQEYWVVQMEKDKETIRKLRKKLKNLRNLGVCMCDFSAFLPQEIPVRTLTIVCSNQEVEKMAPLLRKYHQALLNCGYQAGRLCLHHEDALIFKDDNNAELLYCNIDMQRVRGKGQEFKVTLEKGILPKSIQIDRVTNGTQMTAAVLEIATNKRSFHGRSSTT
ncbi:uncharacterized protein LOC106150738 [Lingula anatina]|uniref:Uncharacterized protein LOC106150738 n=1 Tax=Lingula anatina TaxID=7574 RepID=A0A1S3H118_LINAN|nr:uncharacterized protein LOC106150738 [Lingula anatina]|eukprot:XP_013379176.1 uncharacterized protein LOC106150738 [Lingula anatina]